MNESPEPEIPTFAELAADPEIAALLDFDSVPRKVTIENGWNPEAQREYIARLAFHGSPSKACDEMGKARTGVTKLYKSPFGASFRAAWHGAVELARRRWEERVGAQRVSPGITPPSVDHRCKSFSPRSRDYPEDGGGTGPAPWANSGQIVNEFGEWEDEESLAARADEARDSISAKLQRARRLYLREIAASAGKRAAFEMLTELPVDWEKAQALEPQPDEPWRKPNMRQPDMLLTAENGWLGDVTHGPDKKAQLRQAIDEYRAAEGLPVIQWGQEE